MIKDIKTEEDYVKPENIMTKDIEKKKNHMDLEITNKDNEMEVKGDKKHVCETCGSSFNRPYRLTQHLLLHQNIKLYVCGEKTCNKSYTSKSHLYRHMNSVHMKPNFDVINRCPHCMKVFANRQNLKRHINIKHVKSIVFTCDVCKADFKKKHLLSTHMYNHTFVKSFSCDLCRKEFISIRDRKKHRKNHKTYNCENCDMAFHQWSKYLKHRKSEHTSKEFICNECGRKFKQRHHMVHHVKTHMSVVPQVFSCWYEDCNRVYSRQSNLRQHIRIKHLQLTYSCLICEAQLSTQAKLKAHLQLHSKSDKVSTQPKTKQTGRKERKDKEVPRISTALRIAGLFLDPDNEETKTEMGATEESEKAKNITENKEKSEPCSEIKTESFSNTIIVSVEPIIEMDISETPTEIEIDKEQTAITISQMQNFGNTKDVENNTDSLRP